MREKFFAILFLAILVFIAVFCWQVFNMLFIQTSTQFSDAAVAAFFGAFLAFLFVRIGEFFKSFSERINKGHNALIKTEYLLNSLLGELDDNVYVIETFEKLYDKNVRNQAHSRVFVWANRLTPVKLLDEFVIDFLNIDLINELFTFNVRLRKLNESMETINGAYKESKEALISKSIDAENYIENLTRIRENLLHIKNFFNASIYETAQVLSAVRVLAKNRPLIGYLLKRIPSYKYSRKFNDQRENELKTLLHEMDEIKKNSKSRIDAILNGENGGETGPPSFY